MYSMFYLLYFDGDFEGDLQEVGVVGVAMEVVTVSGELWWLFFS